MIIKNIFSNPHYYVYQILMSLGIGNKVNYVLKKDGIKIPLIYGWGKENLNLAESWMIRIINKIGVNDHFIDIGVNIGQTIVKVKAHYPGIEYFGFEPNYNCVKYVERLVELNNFERIRIFPIGLGEVSGVFPLFVDNEIASSATFLEDLRNSTKGLKKLYLPVFKFDDLELYFPNRTLVKIDVEGFELEAIRGMESFLKSGIRNVICEVLPCYGNFQSSRRDRQIQLFSFLKKIGYQVYLINEENSTLNAIIEFPLDADMSMSNYLFSNDAFLQID
jgi:FkbM family methyltransferase